MTAAALQLLPITEDGRCNGCGGPWPDGTDALLDATRQLYAEQGYHPPWISYLAFVGDEMVGGGAFVGPPTAQGVEIAYFTFPPYESQGVASAMAAELVARALSEPGITAVIAHTMAEENPATRILQRLGFIPVATINDPDDGVIRRWARGR